VYDNRFMHTDRRPDLYLDPELNEGGEVVCQILDREDALPFGARIEANRASSVSNATIITSNSREWLWEEKGQFLAILVPHYRGRHYAKNIMDFKPILKYLKWLHENGCVHGDVRGFNMAIVNEHEGRLIDLDYGGRVKRSDDSEEKKTLDNYPKYPEGYKTDLTDGLRMERESRSPITAKDDVFALAQFMFTYFEADMTELTIAALKRQRELLQLTLVAADDDEIDVLTLYDALCQFTDEAKWDLVPTLRLRRDLEKFGYNLAPSDFSDSVERSAATFPATGSPSKCHRA
jgi:hypothetical protein